MTSNFKQRILVSLATTVAAAVCGLLLGYLLGRGITLRSREAKLDQAAADILARGAAGSAEARVVLAALNASPYPPCSDAEMAFFRRLIFKADYLKDAGRFSADTIACSATIGRPQAPRPQPPATFSQPDGTKLYTHLYPFEDHAPTPSSLRLGNVFVVFHAHMRAVPIAPMHYSMTEFDGPDRKPGWLAGVAPQVPAALMTHDGNLRIGNTLYATHCSARFYECITTYISVSEALQVDRGPFMEYAIVGGLAGGLVGFVLSLVYRRNKSLEHQLRRAIRQDTLKLVYQPIVDMASRRIVGAEALVRWTDEDNFAIEPDVFVKIAEERGFVGEITQLVLRHALREFGALLRNRPDFSVNINISAADLSDSRFLPMLDSAVAQAGIPAGSLGFEITESITARHQVAAEIILHLRERGHRVFIDDFGTGYSSLAYLHDLSVDAIKVDRAFTSAIGTNAVTISILPQILSMAESLQLLVVVEGVETELQAGYFTTAARSILAQGWLFGRPVPAEEFHLLLDGQSSPEMVSTETL
jgi:sensor c-di-GMP phosphodiesterase-like protein